MPTERGQTAGAKMVIGLVVALTVASIMAAFLLPIGIDAMVDDTDVSFTGVAEGETNEVISGSLNVTLDTINDTSNNNVDINVTLTDVDSGNTLVLTNINEGASANGTLEGQTLTVTNDAVAADETTADFTVSHPIQYAWSDGAQALWAILDVILVLALFLMLIGMALAAANRV